MASIFHPVRPAASDPDEGPVSATSRVYDRLRKKIITAEIRPGERLKVEELRRELDVGASPVREALSLLTSTHLVQRLDQRGFRAAPVSDAGFRELLETRCWLEEKALRESIARGDQAWEEQVVLTHHRLARTPRPAKGDREAEDSWEDFHRQFHQALIAACGSTIMLRFCDELYDQNIRYRHIAVGARRYDQRDLAAEHEAIADAAIARDADLAVSSLLRHYRRTGQFLSGLDG